VLAAEQTHQGTHRWTTIRGSPGTMHRDRDVAGDRGLIFVDPRIDNPGSTSMAPNPGRSQNMLVLSRQRDETIMIGDDIEITVVDIRGDKVRLGIQAPKEVTVHRKEVYEAIRRENRAAAQVKPEDLSGLGKISPKGPSKEEKK
jgi:carbon storage regulator